MALRAQIRPLPRAARNRRCRRAARVARPRNRFRHLDTLAAALAKRLRVKDAILDGEVICADETGRPIFVEMLRGCHPMCFVAFDLLWLNGEDLRPLPLVERRTRLKRLLRRRAKRRNPTVMRITSRPPLAPGYYVRLVAELDEIANQIEQRPELNHHAASRLREIARGIRQDAGLIPRWQKPKS